MAIVCNCSGQKMGANPAGMGALMFSSIVGCGVLRELNFANNACTAGLFQMSSLSMEAAHPTHHASLFACELSFSEDS
jgi:hypothetical protein